MSDQTWLWARGYDGGGPFSEMIRRVVHWLMKEPELEERRLEGTRVRCLEAEEPRGKNGDRPPRDCPLCCCCVRTRAAKRKTPQRLESALPADPAPRGGRLRQNNHVTPRDSDL